MVHPKVDCMFRTSRGYKKKQRSVLVLMLSLAAWLPHAQAQAKNEIGLVIGATVTPSQTLSGVTPPSSATLAFKPSLALGAEFDRRFHAGKHIVILGGVDFLASPLDVKLDQRPTSVTPEYAYVFLTPHIRVKFHPNGPLSPWLLFGGGYARYAEATPPGLATAFKAGTNTGALEIGGGVDTHVILHVLRVPIGFRFEVRDFYAGLPNYNLPVSGSLHNNVVFTGGLLIKF
jgi:hypothetical protein